MTAAPVRVVVVGCGYWGRNYVRVLGELPDTRVAAVCDSDVRRLEAVARVSHGIHLTTKLDDALALPGIDAAVVCTPASTHAAVARECLRRGLSVLIEKPIATSSADAEALVHLAEPVGATLMSGHTFLYNAGIRKVKEYIDAGDLGRLYYLYARRTNMGPIRSDVNALWDLAPHDISIFNFLLDSMPERVSAVGSCLLCDDREDYGFITLTYPGDLIAHVHVSWAEPNKTREVVAVGSRKRVTFNDLDPLEQVRVFDKGVSRVVPESSTYGELAFLLRDGDIVSPMIRASEPLKNQCEHFLECVRTGARPLTDGYAGWQLVRAMEALDESLRRRGEAVDLPAPAAPASSDGAGLHAHAALR